MVPLLVVRPSIRVSEQHAMVAGGDDVHVAALHTEQSVRRTARIDQVGRHPDDGLPLHSVAVHVEAHHHLPDLHLNERLPATPGQHPMIASQTHLCTHSSAAAEET